MAEWRGSTILMQRGRTGSHNGVDAEGLWFQHFYPPAADQCWCGWKPAETTVTVTAAQHGVMNPDGTWTVEEWEPVEVTAMARQCGVMNSDGTWTFEECRHAESEE